jgi:hypothetical protein
MQSLAGFNEKYIAYACYRYLYHYVAEVYTT